MLRQTIPSFSRLNCPRTGRGRIGYASQHGVSGWQAATSLWISYERHDHALFAELRPDGHAASACPIIPGRHREQVGTHRRRHDGRPACFARRTRASLRGTARTGRRRPRDSGGTASTTWRWTALDSASFSPSAPLRCPISRSAPRTMPAARASAGSPRRTAPSRPALTSMASPVKRSRQKTWR